MGPRQRAGNKGSFADLVEAASTEVLQTLVLKLASTRPDIRRQCIEFLAGKVPLTAAGIAGAEAEAALALWAELEPDLRDLDAYGGGDRESTDRVASLLVELVERLQATTLLHLDRRKLLNAVFPYIHGDSGMDDHLQNVAYALCYDDADLRALAVRFEATGNDWLLEHARNIYREIGDGDKYLALRATRLVYGADYHDLATFLWEDGQQDQALAVACEGLEKATGRMTELRAFVCEHALEAGDRRRYLDLQLDQATDHLTRESYAAFKQLCTEADWTEYEPRMVAALVKQPPDVRLTLHMFRQEYDQAIAIVSRMRYPYRGDHATVQFAAELEERFPEQVLNFYMTGLGNFNTSRPRAEYALNASVAVKLRRIWVDILKTPDKWLALARKMKALNQRRAAFQEEFARAIPDWHTL